MTDIHDDVAPQWLPYTQTIGGVKWLVGSGTFPCHIMVIGHYPGQDDAHNNAHFSGAAGAELRGKAMACGVDLSSTYMTNICKFMPKGKKPTASDLKLCRPMLEEEIRRANPRLIICLGGEALKAVLGKEYKISTYRGQFIKHPTMPETMVFPTYSLSYAQYNPSAELESNNDWRALHNWQTGKTDEFDSTNWYVTSSTADVATFADSIIAQAEQAGSMILTVDCEWHGKHWMDPNGYIRLIQLGYAPDNALVIELYNEQQQPIYDSDELFAHLKRLLEHPKVQLVGQNAIADGEWLLTYNIDIRPNVVFDTMLAEHTLNSAGVFNLTALTEKYTRMGKYDVELNAWVQAHPAETALGYGLLPRDILIPYAAKDACATYRVFLRQQKPLVDAGYVNPRGEYPSLFQASLDAQRALYEIQRHGMRVDKTRLLEITKAYQDKLKELESQMVTITAQLGIPDFNFRSPDQVQHLLFEVLGLTPVKATAGSGGQTWDIVLKSTDGDVEDINASTDKRTLDILQDHHPAVKLLRNLRKIDHACKTWLMDPQKFNPEIHNETTSGGGMLSKIWPDGRVHASFSQLMETGRFSSRRPNMQNFPKKAEGDIERIFVRKGKDGTVTGEKPPDLRTMFVPDDGYVFLEADWKQAELFVLAALSGDATMMEALRTPGKDLHDLTAITSFGLKVYDKDGREVPEQQLIDMAKADPNWDKDDSPFKKFQKTLFYVDQRGHRMSRKEFKDTIRVSAKNLNFGIPYGRGALDIAVQVKAETGTDVSIDDLRAQIDTMMTAWKTNTYPAAWGYMQQCASNVEEHGFVENPWGRRRIFPRSADKRSLAAMKREAQNFPIQSTVADTCLIALRMLMDYRQQHGLHYRIVNQVHDAIILEVPINEVEQAKQACLATMGNIYIPVPHQPLRLDIDMEVMTRWSEKQK